MPFFGSLSDIIASLSPRRPRPDRPSLPQHSDTRTSRNRSPCPDPETARGAARKQNEFSLAFDDDDDLEELPENPFVNATSILNTESDANTLSPYFRGRLRSPSSQIATDPSARLDMPSWPDPADRHSLINRPNSRPGHSPPMLSKERKLVEDQARDEARLLGTKRVKDEGATPIRPGSFAKPKKIPGSSAAFRPTDRISHGSRDSGPVRAQGKSKPSKPYVGKNPPRLSDDLEESVRPNKRRRYDDLGKHDHKNEFTSDQISRLSPGSSQYSSSKQKSSGWFSRNEEYRGVEESMRVPRSPHRQHRRFSATSQDETFTAHAAEERRSTSGQQSLKPQKRDHSRLGVLETIEVPSIKNPSQNPSTEPRANGLGDTSVSRESPDELQGEATTQPIPKNLDEKSKPPCHKRDDRLSSMSPVRKRSLADIQPTNFADSPRQGPKKMKRSHKSNKVSRHDVTSFRFGSIVKKVKKGESATVGLDEHALHLDEDIVGPGQRLTIPLQNVFRAVHGGDPCLKIRLKLAKKNDAPGDMIDIEFLTATSKRKLMVAVQNLQIKTIEKDMSHMDKAFAQHERQLIEHGNSTPRPFLDSTLQEPIIPSAQPPKRPRLSDALQSSADEAVEKEQSKTQGHSHENPESVNDSRKSCRLQQETDPGVDIPVKPFRGEKSPERETRKTARRTTRLSDRLSGGQDEKHSPSRSRHHTPENDTGREKWKKPLVYPQAGKKRAEVNVEDRDRLREGEFLNDNLIGLYMRFLQDHLERTNPQVAQRVYFFNSYFFATLTNTPKGDRGINYGGVEKWTRNVDLFSYDYIVVPINQNAHWYVAVVCNLPSLVSRPTDGAEPPSAGQEDPSKGPTSEVLEIPESQEPEPPSSALSPVDRAADNKRPGESPGSQEARQSLACMSLEGQDARQENEGRDEPRSADELPLGEAGLTTDPSPSTPVQTQEKSAAESQSTRKSKKKNRSGPKLDPYQPTIVTFDSLGHSRSPTIKILREYVCKEAGSKRGLEVDSADIKGMCARQIPLQPNFSDCGLYLLAYLEKFIQDPDPFTRKLLRREMDENADWPPLGSGLLRYRLRNFLDELYEEQARLRDKKMDHQPIMADQRPISFLLGPPLPSQDVEDQPQPQPAPAEPTSTATELPKGKQSIEESVARETPVHETSESNDDSNADQLQLVPTDSVAAAMSAKLQEEKTVSSAAPGKQPSKLRDEDVIEVPDSQEPIPTTRSQQPAPGLRFDENTKPTKKRQLGYSRKSERKKAAIPTDANVVNVADSVPDKPASVPKVEIQVRATPPPKEPETVRKSPRGATRKA